MKIAIAANENHIKAIIDPHFGRCNWFFLYDTESKKGEFVENPVRHMHEKAGAEAAGFLLDKEISLVVAGRFGSKVVDVFRTNKVQIVIPEKQQTIQHFIGTVK